VPPIRLQELESASKRLRARKALGPDGINNEILKIKIKLQPQMLRILRTFNSCLEEGTFPKQCKQARLVYLAKLIKWKIFHQAIATLHVLHDTEIVRKNNM